MENFVCFICGLKDRKYYSVCPSCGEEYNVPKQPAFGKVEVRFINENKGRGVFASIEIPQGNLVESCPVIIIPEEENEILRQTPSLWYNLFPWKKFHSIDGPRAFTLGYGTLYNHSEKPNAGYRFNDNKTLPSIDFQALRNISAGEEITIKYAAKDFLWFNTEE